MVMKKLMILGAIVAATIGLVACENDADVVSRNISKSADQFEVPRRIVFYNGISGEYILTIQGLCSIGNYDKANRLSVTCKAGANSYKKHFLGLSDNVTFFAEQLENTNASASFYKVIFKPSVIIPDIDIR